MENNGYLTIDEMIKPASEMLKVSCKDGKARNEDLVDLQFIVSKIEEAANQGYTFVDVEVLREFSRDVLVSKGYRIDGDFKLYTIHWD